MDGSTDLTDRAGLLLQAESLPYNQSLHSVTSITSFVALQTWPLPCIRTVALQKQFRCHAKYQSPFAFKNRVVLALQASQPLPCKNKQVIWLATISRAVAIYKQSRCLASIHNRCLANKAVALPASRAVAFQAEGCCCLAEPTDQTQHVPNRPTPLSSSPLPPSPPIFLENRQTGTPQHEANAGRYDIISKHNKRTRRTALQKTYHTW